MDQETQITITPEMTQNELNAFRYVPLFLKSFAEGATLKDLATLTEQGAILSAENGLSKLANQPTHIDSGAYFSSKILVRETTYWLELLINAYLQHTKQTEVSDAMNAVIAPLKDKLFLIDEKLSTYRPQLLAQRKIHLHTDFIAQSEKIKNEMKILLFETVKTSKNIPLMHYAIGKKVMQKVEERLEKAKNALKEHRDTFEQKLLEYGCNIYIHMPSHFCYPVIYTKGGSIYIIQEVVEHFVGVGAFKIVSRTFEMQQGAIRALIRPKKKFDDHLSLEEKNDLMHTAFLQSFIEADIIKHASGKPGIIKQYEACAFLIENEPTFYHICELFDSTELHKILLKIIEKKDGGLSKESIFNLAHGLLTALVSLKSSSIIHRDLKNDNILTHLATEHMQDGIRIIDFNNSCFISQERAKVKFPVSEIAPPEFCKIFIQKGYRYICDEYKEVTNYTQDTWAIGIHLYILFFQENVPWKKNIPSYLEPQTSMPPLEREKIREEKVKHEAHMISALTEPWIDEKFHSHPMYPLIRATLAVDPHQRISAEDALTLLTKLKDQYLNTIK